MGSRTPGPAVDGRCSPCSAARTRRRSERSSSPGPSAPRSTDYVGDNRTLWVDRYGDPVPPPRDAVEVVVLAAPVLAVAAAAGMIGAWLVTTRRSPGRRC
ncbi:hypothetical protein [Actinomycetospora lemnae]|uniref:Uncharacterized protein n=1 Tax=Actinomycetospora lemnae TaxID=3019891 RepID=A0ABT5SQ28_9PSEU|nr:hypothetical protein [Actinomycetospora sp. DW7H6]MDD7963888.1 hypothetical protein [Actinomycetospora sp. DW7H6]